MGTPGPKPRPEADRFWEKVDKSGDCWLWTAATTANGYGSWHGADERLAHRWAYREMVGPIPDGLHIDHLCRVRACVNPDHLEAVTQAENNRRADSRAFKVARRRATLKRNAERRAAALAQTECPNGHAWTEANTRLSAKGTRICRRCAAESARNYRARRQVA